MSKSTTLRHLMMLKILPKYPSFILVKDLQSALEEAGFKVELRTVQRDLRNMQDLMGLDCCDSPEGYKWRYARVNTEMLPNMRPNEALLLVIAESYLKRVLPGESLSLLEPRLKKARVTLEQGKPLGRWQDKLQIIPGELPLTPLPVNEEIRATIYDCLLNEEQLTLLYQKKPDLEPQVYTLNPQGLIVRDHNHYLVASKAETPDKQQMFLFSKIQKVERQYADANLGQMPSFDSFKELNPTGFVLEEEQPIILQVRRAPARILTGNKISDDQTVEYLSDEWFEVRATSTITYDLINWISQHVQSVKIISPEKLRNEVVSKLQKGLEINA